MDETHSETEEFPKKETLAKQKLQIDFILSVEKQILVIMKGEQVYQGVEHILIDKGGWRQNRIMSYY